jgi:hypothetical protein
MTDDFDSIFSGRSPGRPSFVQRTGKAPEPAAPATDRVAEPHAETGYKAFGYLPTSTVGESCDIQRWVDGTEIPEGLEMQYRFLLSIAYTGEEELKLYMPECIVLITGEHLRELRKKLARRQCTFIMQYSPKVWPERPPSGEPIVDAIEVLRPDPSGPPGRNY